MVKPRVAEYNKEGERAEIDKESTIALCFEKPRSPMVRRAARRSTILRAGSSSAPRFFQELSFGACENLLSAIASPFLRPPAGRVATMRARGVRVSEARLSGDRSAKSEGSVARHQMPQTVSSRAQGDRSSRSLPDGVCFGACRRRRQVETWQAAQLSQDGTFWSDRVWCGASLRATFVRRRRESSSDFCVPA
jgi:hypothetical protein